MDVEPYVREAFIASIVASPKTPGLSREELIELGKEDGYGPGEINDELKSVTVHYGKNLLFNIDVLQDFIGSVDIDFLPEFRNLAAMDQIHRSFFEKRKELGIDHLGTERRTLVADGESHGISEYDMEVALTCMLVGNVLVEHDGIIKPVSRERDLHSSKKNRVGRMDFMVSNLKAFAERIRKRRGTAKQYASSEGSISLPKTGHEDKESIVSKRVFVIHGRNLKAAEAMKTFLWSLGLSPWDFDELVAAEKGSPWVGDVVIAGMKCSEAVIALFTPDEEAHLVLGSNPEERRRQARQNVIYETGLAQGIDASKVIVVTLGSVELFSDLLGRHVVRLNNEASKRMQLKQRLNQLVGPLRDTSEMLTAGEFESCVEVS